MIRVAVIVVSWRTVGADSSDADVLSLADALVGDVAVELIDTGAGQDVAGLFVLIIDLSGEAARACSLHDVISRCAVALAAVEVVDLVGSALHSADALVDVVNLTGGALSAEVVDEVESGLADAST